MGEGGRGKVEGGGRGKVEGGEWCGGVVGGRGVVWRGEGGKGEGAYAQAPKRVFECVNDLYTERL